MKACHGDWYCGPAQVGGLAWLAVAGVRPGTLLQEEATR